MPLNSHTVHNQIQSLKILFPDLAQDDDGWELTLTSETDLDGLLSQLIRLYNANKALAAETDRELADLQARCDRFERRVEAYRAMMLKVMIDANIERRELPLATVSVRRGIKHVVITDEKALSTEYLRIKTEPDKLKLKKALEEGATIVGACLSNTAPSLSIRVK